MILDALGTLSDAQALSVAGSGVVQSTNWIDLGAYTDRLGVTTGADMGAGNPFFIHFRVTTAFSNSAANATATFRVVLFTDDGDPPASNSGTCTFLPASHEVINTLGVGFANSLPVGATFMLPLCSPQGAAMNPNNTLLSRACGQRFLRCAYQFSAGSGTNTGGIEAILTTQSMTRGKVNANSKYVGGIYPSADMWDKAIS